MVSSSIAQTQRFSLTSWLLPLGVGYAMGWVALEHGLDEFGMFVGALAIALVCVSSWVIRKESAWQVRQLPIFTALWLFLFLRASTMAVGWQLLSWLAAIAWVGTVIDLALLSAAFEHMHVSRQRGGRWLTAVALCALALFVSYGVVEAGSEDPQTSTMHALFGVIRAPQASAVFVIIGMVCALVIRVRAKRHGRYPTWAADNSWATSGMASGLISLAAGAILAGNTTPGVCPPIARVLFATGATVTACFFAVASFAEFRKYADRVSKFITCGFLSLGATLVVFVLLPWSPRFLSWHGWFVTLVFLLMWLIVFLLALPAVSYAVQPARGRLIDALKEISQGFLHVSDWDAVVAHTLLPLRHASLDMAAMPMLFSVDPPRLGVLDASGLPRTERRPIPKCILHYIDQHPGEALPFDVVEERAVRRADVRELAEWMQEEGVLCVCPVTCDREIEGVLVVPKGTRRARLSFEELHLLMDVSRWLGAMLGLISAKDRAQERELSSRSLFTHVKDELDHAREELTFIHAARDSNRYSHAIKETAWMLVAHSAAMRDALERIHAVSVAWPHAILLGERASGLDAVTAHLHSRYANEGILLEVCASQIDLKNIPELLFGVMRNGVLVPGWLHQAKGGLLAIHDAHVLSESVRSQLSEWVQVKHFRPVGRDAFDPLECRVVLTLPNAASLSDACVRAFGDHILCVPPLRERTEDIPPLAWSILGILQAGKEGSIVGIEEQALERLSLYDWPGNFDELWTVLDGALQAATNERIVLTDLPASFQ